MEKTDGRWSCPHCLKTYSKSYRYKTHITRCLSHNLKLDCQAEISQITMGEMKQELKQELKDEMRMLLEELRDTMTSSAATITQQTPLPPPPPIQQTPPHPPPTHRALSPRQPQKQISPNILRGMF